MSALGQKQTFAAHKSPLYPNCGQVPLAAAEDGFYVVAVRIAHEGRVVTWRITFAGIAKPRRPVIGSARFEGGRVKGVDLGAALGSEGRMLLHAVRMKAVDPENRMLVTIADAVSSIILGNLHNPSETERAESGIVEGRRSSANVRDADARMVDHVGLVIG